MSEKNPSEFTCNVMERLDTKEKLAQHKRNISNLLNDIATFTTTHTNYITYKETSDSIGLLKMQLKGELGKIETKELENNRILHSLLESAIEFK